MSARYLTTTLPYVNDKPHLGHALEFVQADALVRSWRLNGDDVFFNTGTDEHGQKIFEAARKAEKDVQEYVDYYAAEFKKLPQALGLDNPTFIRTTDPKHVAAVEEIWKRWGAAGDIYQKEFEGLYCVGHEAFITEKELVDGKCPEHGKEPQLLREKNYFFKFSKYENYLLEYLNRKGVIIPEWRRQEAIKFVQGGLEDLSISRDKQRLSWGIPVPGDDAQVVYVWFDALTNYISTLGWPEDREGNFKKFWEEGQVVQVAGKDQIRFQSLMWQAMLKSAGIKASDVVFYHGFINSGGVKMSKSLGNVINPSDLIQKYGTDATRYLLLRHVHPVEDSDVTWERLDEWYTAHLVNGLGNFVARIMKLSEDHLTANEISNFPEDVKESERIKEFHTAIENFRFNEAMDMVWKYISNIDELINQKRPFELIKTDTEKGKGEIHNLVWRVSRVARLLEPVMPTTAEIIKKAVRENKKPENLFPRLP